MKHFWKDALERAVKTAAQTAVAALGTSTVLGQINWLAALSTVGAATLMSLLTSLASSNLTGTNSASLVDREGK